MTVFQKVECWGDSLTFGARSAGCYPMYLAQMLKKRTKYEWQVVNRGVNGNTARDLWFRVNDGVRSEPNHHAACVLIGTNDAKDGTPVEIFAGYYEQVLSTLQMHGWTVVACQIPLIVSLGRLPYTKRSEMHRIRLNKVVAAVAASVSVPVIDLRLRPSDLIDGVHWNESGNRRAAAEFAEAVLSL